MPRKQPRNRPPSQHVLTVPTDYETDEATFSDAINMSGAPRGPLTTSALNLVVIRRHNPSIVSILAIAPYAVVYTFNTASQEWEKSNVEGSMFIVALEGTPAAPERFAVMILNRRGLDNFFTELFSPDDVDDTEEYIILQTEAPDGVGNPGVPIIYGLWIFSESGGATQNAVIDRATIAKLIGECAERTKESRRVAAAAAPQVPEEHQHHVHAEIAQAEANLNDSEDPTSAPMGRQISLRQLFGHQREVDSGWSVHHHETNSNPLQPPTQSYQQPPPLAVPRNKPPTAQHPPAPPFPHHQPPQPTANALEATRSEMQFAPTPEMEFFQTAKPFTPPVPPANGAGPTPGQGQQNALLDLFKNAQVRRESSGGF
ncbi:PH domain-like protein [Eremomyces bilateralis CBS 781.70]|uniref:PH domain-like protein n=1 Tax=Eremomyces bilateralis CBS 781.70 TaxID=1392243 RepID=A0A6G1FTQ5_9PEZI|nr:PH domain-like protein [Eremomyces bilateralis CBS 781.70]KAF1809265.1 PH domain-like protein [Eremomyces bilateralis CBS 781.70]